MNNNKKNKIMQNRFTNSRRSFLKTGAASVVGGALFESLPLGAYAQSNKIIRVGLVGCGGRGTGAAFEALQASKSMKLVAMGDAFQDMLNGSYAKLAGQFKDQVDVPEKRKFTGLDAYEKVIAECDAVILATPPPFRPAHFEEAIRANKHVFMEKPLAVDVPGYRKIIEVGKTAEAKKLNVVVGLQNRYDTSYAAMIEKIRGGMIGDIVSVDVYYNVGAPLVHPRLATQTELEYQLRNWRYFGWLWGGQLAGQAIHQIDVINWLMQDYPTFASGIGGRQLFSGPNQGNTFDHQYVEYIYPNGVRMHVQCRNMNNCGVRQGFYIRGTKGYADERSRIFGLDNKIAWRFRDGDEEFASTQLEQNVFYNALANGPYVNNTDYGAKSTLTTIMGRMATHSGQDIKLEEVLASNLSIVPEKLTWDAKMPDQPDASGNYEIPVPGKTRVI
jgi:myo-inositol 2-dehydrogenase / D-chiro-inositol 1-dehydrogenase